MVVILSLLLLGLRGIRLKRLAGNPWDYKRLIERVISRCRL